MLSNNEYRDLVWKLDNIPSTITGTTRRNLRNTFKKKLHEHELASRYPPFQPSNYEQYFINFRTDIPTLNHLIEKVKSYSIFTLDTESTIIPRRPNKPSLIQIQIVISSSYSYVIFVEVCHLPPKHAPTFSLIKKFFQTLFNVDNTIFIWGEISELNNFVLYELFTYTDLNISDNINLQKKFKLYWNEKYSHRISSPSLSRNYIECMCETCLGIDANNPWSLQNAVAYELHQWLDKRQTKNSFSIGLDPQLYHYNLNELEHRNSLTQYAAYDCLSMQQLLVELNLIEHYEIAADTPTAIIVTIENELDLTCPNSPTISSPINESPLSTEALAATPIITTSNNHYNNNDLENISSDDDQLGAQQFPQLLTTDQRKWFHNRKRTLKQRKRLYKHEIIKRGIDPRFTIKQIKQILREHNIHFCAVNTATSSLTHRTSLYVGVKNPHLLSTYEPKIEKLFTTDCYNELNLKQQEHRVHNHHHTRRHHYHR